MQDSNIVYKVTAVGAEEAAAKFNELGATIQRMNFNANGTVTASGKLTSSLANQENQTGRTANATNKAAAAQENYFVHIAKTTVQSALVNKAFLGIVDSMGKAAQQVDLLQNFPASMAALGLSSKDASESILTLRDYISKVGGDLTTATTSVARFAEVTRDVKAATAEYVGVNNALIAGGAGAEVQASALEQLTQAYSRGKPQLIEWKSLMVAMPAQLSQVAQAMNKPNAQALGTALTTGKVSMQDFLTELTKLSTGTGPIAQQAIARMQGIQFASNVMKNSLTNGLAAIYQAVGRQNIISFFNFMTDVIRTLTSWVVILINDLISLFNWVSKVFGGPQIAHFTGEAQGAADALGDGSDNAKDMADGLDDADKKAKKLQKGIASFDKMNVLADKTSGDTPDAGNGTQNGLDPKTAGELGKIFDGIGGSLKEATVWAKIFAGILAGLATNALVSKLFGFNPLKELTKGLKDAAKGALGLNDSVKKASDSSYKLNQRGAEAGKSWGTKFGEGAAKSVSGLGGIIGGAIGGLTSQIGKYIGPAIGGFFATIGGAILDALLAVAVPIAVALGVPLELAVGLVVLAVAAIIAAIFLIWKNWDKIWGFIKKTSSKAWQAIQKVWDGVLDFFVKLWQNVYKTAIKPVVDAIKTGFNAVVGFFRKWGADILAIILSPFILAGAGVILFAAGVIAIFKGIWAGIVLIFSVAAAFFGTIFKAAWDAITVVWDIVVSFFQAIWDGITKIFSTVVGFIGGIFSSAWNAVAKVWNIVASWFNINVIQPVLTFFSPVTSFLGKVFSDAWNAIKKVWNTVSGFFSGIWTNITKTFGGVGSWFSTRFKDAYNSITGIFGGLWSWFKKNVWDKITSVFSKVGTSIGNAISGAVKSVINTVLRGVIGTVNGFLGLLRGAINVINKAPGVNINTSGLRDIPIPHLAVGGVVNQATMAVLGESGSEAVMPLENNTEWIDKLASKINGSNTSANSNPDIIPVTNKREQQPAHNFTIHVSGVFATSAQEQRKVADLIGKQFNAALKAKGQQGIF